MQIKASWCAIIAFWCTDSFISALTLLLWLCVCELWLAGSAVGMDICGSRAARQKDVLCTKVCKERENNDGGHILPLRREESKIYSHSHPHASKTFPRRIFVIIQPPIRVHRGRSNFVPRAIFTQNSLASARTRRKAHYSNALLSRCSEKILSLRFLC